MEENRFISQVALNCQIIKSALALGIIVFGGMLQWMPQKENDIPQSPWLIVMVGMVISAIFARLIVPRLLVSKARAQLAKGEWPLGKYNSRKLSSDTERLAMIYQTQIIAGSAMLEGAAFMCLVTHMMNNDLVSISLAVMLLIGLLIDFPTKRTISEWIERQQRLLDQEKSLVRGPM